MRLRFQRTAKGMPVKTWVANVLKTWKAYTLKKKRNLHLSRKKTILIKKENIENTSSRIEKTSQKDEKKYPFVSSQKVFYKPTHLEVNYHTLHVVYLFKPHYVYFPTKLELQHVAGIPTLNILENTILVSLFQKWRGIFIFSKCSLCELIFIFRRICRPRFSLRALLHQRSHRAAFLILKSLIEWTAKCFQRKRYVFLNTLWDQLTEEGARPWVRSEKVSRYRCVTHTKKRIPSMHTKQTNISFVRHHRHTKALTTITWHALFFYALQTSPLGVAKIDAINMLYTEVDK